MKVTLISFTPEPDVVLIFTKNTRLTMNPGLLDEIRGWSAEKKAAELAYMATTIRSSWEFVDLTFLIEGVSRAAAQQITRTRTASYAMQTQRTADVSGMEVYVPDLDPDQRAAYLASAKRSVAEYADAIRNGMSPQDARGLLPMNITCNLVAKYNLRSLVDVLTARESLRAQGEYRDVATEMKRLTLGVMPWAAPFFESRYKAAITMLEDTAKALGIEPGKGTGWEIAKAIDLLRGA